MLVTDKTVRLQFQFNAGNREFPKLYVKHVNKANSLQDNRKTEEAQITTKTFFNQHPSIIIRREVGMQRLCAGEDATSTMLAR